MAYPFCVCVCVCCEYLFLTGFACYTLSLFVSPSRYYFSLWLHVSRIVTDYRCLNARVGKSLIDFLPIWMQHFAPPPLPLSLPLSLSLALSCILYRKLFHLILILFLLLFYAFEYIHCCLDYYSLWLRIFIGFHFIWHEIVATFAFDIWYDIHLFNWFFIQLLFLVFLLPSTIAKRRIN